MLLLIEFTLNFVTFAKVAACMHHLYGCSTSEDASSVSRLCYYMYRMKPRICSPSRRTRLLLKTVLTSTRTDTRANLPYASYITRATESS